MHVQKFACFCVNLLQFADFPVNNAKTIMHNWKCKAIDSFYLVSSIELVLTINLTLLLCVFLSSHSFCHAGYHHFYLHPGIYLPLPGPTLVFLCPYLLLYFQLRSVYLSWNWLWHIIRPKSIRTSWTFFNYFQFSDLFVFVLAVKFEIIHIKTDCWLEHLRFWSYNHAQM